MSEDFRVVIIGAGLIGGSISLSLADRQIAHDIIDIKDHSKRELEEKGDRFSRLAPEQVNLVIVAVPPEMCASVIEDCLIKYHNSFVLDVASVKLEIETSLRDNPEFHRYVGTHPMAGKQISGSEYADPNLFQDRVWIICANEVNQKAVAAAENFLRIFTSSIVQMSATEHDFIVAKLSHLPQIMSSLLVNLAAGNQNDFELAGPGFKDMTRLANSNPEMWTQILFGNKSNLVKILQNAAEVLLQISNQLQGNDSKAIANFLTNSNKLAKLIPAKHGEIDPKFSSIVIRVDDKPGSLADIFNLAAKMDVNIEDVYIDHILNKPLALITIFVKREEEDRTRSAYLDAGWQVRG